MSGSHAGNEEQGGGLVGPRGRSAETGPTEPGAGAACPVELAPRQRLGRYELRGLVGAGGMGLVYAAWDPHLRRKVALKVLRPGLGEQQRLLREAQAIARLSHPHIITVYDAGLVGEEFFLAMELVEGETLAAWLARGRRSWREVVEVYAKAGEGLAAAHAMGVVHCDFKPENVLLGQDGRVLVLDFGIALLGEEPVAGGGPQAPATGTPAYMAPEQHVLAPAVEPRSDQYSFCVALHEGLYGQRPFAPVEDVQRLVALKQAQALLPAPAGSGVPAHVHRALVRGLRASPQERWPDMRALLAELRRDTRRPLRRRLLMGALVATHLAGFAIAWALRAHTAPCKRGAEQLAGLWDEPTKARARLAVLSHGAPHAQATWAHLEQALTGYTTRWVAAYEEACAATNVHKVQSPQLLDLRMACLEVRRQSVAALVALLGEGDEHAIRAAPSALLELPGLEDCADGQALLKAQPLPESPALRRQVQQFRHELARAQVLLSTGRYNQALQQAHGLAEHVLPLGYLPLQAELELLRGRAFTSRQSIEPARRHLYQAVWAAEASRHDDVAAQALSLLYQTGSEEPGLRGRAEAAILRSGRAELRSSLATADGGNAFNRGDYAQALAHFQQALELHERHLGPEHPQNITLLNNVAAAHEHLGEYAPAQQALSRALALGERQFGAKHPRVVLLRLNEAALLTDLGQYARALRQVEACMEQLREELGAWHTFIRMGELTRAHALAGLGHAEQTQALLTELLASEAWRRQRSHPLYLEGVHLLGRLQVQQGQPARASRLLHQALEELRRHGAQPGAALQARLLSALGLARLHQGQHERARRLLLQALHLQQQALPSSHPDLATTLHSLGQLHARLGRCPQALQAWQQALRIRQHSLGDHHPLTSALLKDMAHCPPP